MEVTLEKSGLRKHPEFVCEVKKGDPQRPKEQQREGSDLTRLWTTKVKPMRFVPQKKKRTFRKVGSEGTRHSCIPSNSKSKIITTRTVDGTPGVATRRSDSQQHKREVKANIVYEEVPVKSNPSLGVARAQNEGRMAKRFSQFWGLQERGLMWGGVHEYKKKRRGGAFFFRKRLVDG